VTEYTREAGVRQLERELGTLLRRTATTIASTERGADPIVVDRAAVVEALGRPKFFHEAAIRTAVPGVATGLAVTGVGGDVLFVEAASMAGKGGLVLTGQLGDVMKESARIALTYVKSHAIALGIDEHALDGREVHVHVPAGAIPKDGPSAGITMVTAIASLLTGRPVKSTVGMTGEVTLQGRVLPIGGLKQKVLAAHAAGLTEVIVPERNGPDLDDVPSDVRRQMTFHQVGTIDEVLAVALEADAVAKAA
jgi:ATP-dependent Lon protease